MSGRSWRVGRRTLICVVAGVVLTLATVLLASYVEFRRGLPAAVDEVGFVPTASGEEVVAVRWRRFGVEHWTVDRLFFGKMRDRWPNPMTPPRWVPEAAPGLGSGVEACVYGWPLGCMKWEATRVTTEAPPLKVNYSEMYDIDVQTQTRTRYRFAAMWSGGPWAGLVLPLRPVCTGLVVDTLFFTVIAAMFRVGVAAIRRRRVTVGHCIACGYDLRGVRDRCPECGAGPLLSRGAAAETSQGRKPLDSCGANDKAPDGAALGASCSQAPDTLLRQPRAPAMRAARMSGAVQSGGQRKGAHARPFRRIALRLFACAAIGLLLTLVSAQAAAIWEWRRKLPLAYDVRAMSSWYVPAKGKVLFVVRFKRTGMEYWWLSWLDWPSAPAPPDSEPFEVPSWVPAPDPYSDNGVRACAYGWPLGALKWEADIESSAASGKGLVSDDHYRGAVMLGTAQPAEFWNTLMLPLYPVWPGLLLDSLLWALVPAAVIGLTGLRRRWRFKPGHCTHCGYNVRGLARCPECGREVLNHQRGANA